MRSTIIASSMLLASLIAGPFVAGQDRPPIDLRKKLKDNAEDFWIYDDLDRGYTRGRDTGKPLLVSIR